MEALYRGKQMDTDRKQTLGDWVEGHYYTQVYLPDTIEEDWYHFIKPIGSGIVGYVRVSPNTVDPFTGWEDCMGKRIFNNDILRFPSGNCYPVVYDKDYKTFGSCYYSDFEPMYKYKGLRLEKVGNIHDNPELLNNEKPFYYVCVASCPELDCTGGAHCRCTDLIERYENLVDGCHCGNSPIWEGRRMV